MTNKAYALEMLAMNLLLAFLSFYITKITLDNDTWPLLLKIYFIVTLAITVMGVVALRVFAYYDAVKKTKMLEEEIYEIKEELRMLDKDKNTVFITQEQAEKCIEKDLKLLELIKQTCDINIREVQGNYYLFIGNSIKGARPLTKEEIEILGEKYDN